MLNLTVAMIKIILLKLLLPIVILFPSVNDITPVLYVINPTDGKIVAGTV
ncbi:MAG: hypothetical protein Q8R87_03790 [Anaerolineaceae bacterium]|nr:hypothetical protein [Anaerolineaceae bacterium]